MLELLLVIVTQYGSASSVFAPGDGIYLKVSAPGQYYVEIVDTSTGAKVHVSTIYAPSPGTYLIWQTTPHTAEGTYRIYVRSEHTADVYQIQLTRSPPWWIWNIAAVAAAATAVLIYLTRAGRIFSRKTKGYSLILPNGVAITSQSERTIYGREFFLHLGVPREIAQYISRTHFAIFESRGRYYLEDLGSKNGTFLNGRPIRGLKPQPLKDGDIINVANALTLRFREKR